MPVFRMKIVLDQLGAGEIYNAVHTINETEFAWQSYSLATGTTDQAIPFNLTTGVTAIDLVLIASNYAISYKQAAADTAMPIDAGKVHILWGTNISALLMSNSSGSTATVQVFIAGV